MSGALSPNGDAHPGVINHSDATTGRTWQRKAADVPQSIAWGQVEDRWIPVVRVEATGAAGRLRISRFGPDDALIDTTVQAPPRPAPVETPVPAKVPVLSKVPVPSSTAD